MSAHVPEERDDDLGLGEAWARVRGHLGARSQVVVFAAISLVAGLAEAGVIVALSAAGVAAAGGHQEIALGIGPISLPDVSVGRVLWAGGGILVVMASARMLAAWLGARMTTHGLVAARARVLEAFLRSDWETQSGERIGHVHELASTHAMRVAQAVHVVATGLTSLLGFLSLVVVAVVVAPVIALTLLGTTALLVLLLRPLVLRTRKHASQHLGAHNALVETVVELTGVLPEIRVFGVRDAMLDRVTRAIAEAAGPHRRARFLSMAVPALYIVGTLALLLVGVAGLYALGPGQLLETGAVVLFMLRSMRYAMTMQASLQGLFEQAPHLRQLDESIERFARRAEHDRPRGVVLEQLGTLRLVSVGYTYPTGEQALRDVDVALHPGEVIGIVGPSGAGKSTLVQILLGLRTPTTGRVVADGHDLATVDRSSWFNRIGYVAQHPGLITGDVDENVRFLRDAAAQDVEAAVEAASLHTDVGRWAAGLSHHVGAGGRELSGGQRQRLALARALVGRPDLLVLDEPTSAVDVTSEQRVQASIARLRGHTTVVIVAHRPTTLDVCDRVLLVDGGRVSEVEPSRDLHGLLSPQDGRLPAGPVGAD